MGTKGTLWAIVGWGIGFGIGLLAAGCGPQEEDVGQTDEGSLVLGRAEVTEQVQRAVAPSGRELVLDGFRGAVRLEGANAETAQLAFTKRARGQDDAAARKLMDRMEIRESGNDTQYTYSMRSPAPNQSAVDVSGSAPWVTRLRVEVGNGPVVLDSLRGPIEVNHENGSVQISKAAASVRVTTRNGDLAVGLQEVPADAQVRLETANGNIQVALPEVTSARVAARTSAGDIRTEGLNFKQRRLEPKGAGAQFEAQLGAGNATIDLRTENGTITLRAGTIQPGPMQPDTTALPPPDSARPVPADSPAAASPSDTTAPPAPAPDTSGADEGE